MACHLVGAKPLSERTNVGILLTGPLGPKFSEIDCIITVSHCIRMKWGMLPMETIMGKYDIGIYDAMCSRQVL